MRLAKIRHLVLKAAAVIGLNDKLCSFQRTHVIPRVSRDVSILCLKMSYDVRNSPDGKRTNCQIAHQLLLEF